MIILFLLFLVSQLLRCSSLSYQRRISLHEIKQELFFIETMAKYARVSAWCLFGRCAHKERTDALNMKTVLNEFVDNSKHR